MKKSRNLNWILHNGHFDKLSTSNGENLFLIDTGVIIDLENAYHNNGRLEENRPAIILEKLESEYTLIITPGVMKEIESHAQCQKGNRDEISSSTSILANRIYEESNDLFHYFGIKRLSFDIRENHRYAITLAAFESFRVDYRKGIKDKISYTDKELLSIALDLCQCLCQCESNYEKNGTINILSPDEHVVRTISMIKSDKNIFGIPFSKYNIRAINSRGNLKSYLSK